MGTRTKKKATARLIDRCGHWYLGPVVPKGYREIEPQRQISIAPGTDNVEAAGRAGDNMRLDFNIGMAVRLLLVSTPAAPIEVRYKAAVNTARALDMTSVQTKDLLAGNPNELVRHQILAAKEDLLAIRRGVADAALGVVARPSPMLAEVPARAIQLPAHDSIRKCHRQDDDWNNDVKRSLGALMTAGRRDVQVLSIGHAEARMPQ